MLTFGLRALAAFAFFVMDNPNGRLVTFTLVVISLMGSLQGMAVDIVYTKRLPGDVRGSLQGVRALFGNLGHLAFVAVSLGCIDFFGSIHISAAFCSIFDGSIFFFSFLAYTLSSFDKDDHMGVEARRKGVENDLAISGARKLHTQ